MNAENKRYRRLLAARVADKCDRLCDDRLYCSCHHWALARAKRDDAIDAKWRKQKSGGDE